VRILERMYRSTFGRVMSFVARKVDWMNEPVMVYGYYDYPSGSFRKYTRMSNTVKIMNRKSLSVGDHVWVNHYSILYASQGLIIEEGCQIGPWVGILTHGSEDSIRLLGRDYVHIPYNERKGYNRGSIKIGAYTLVGAKSIILPGAKIGKGCLIAAGTIVTKDIPDYAIVIGSPGEIKGNTIERDKKFFKDGDFFESYYDSQALAMVKQSLALDTDKKSVISGKETA
jgi:acetyltransferase-like isoleucine patch superfamily enzyme